MLASEMVSQTPTIGPYRFHEEIGPNTWRAVHITTGQLVRVCFVSQAVSRLAHARKEVRHSRIAAVLLAGPLPSGSEKADAFVVVEEPKFFFSLADRVTQQRPLRPERAVELVLGLMQAVQVLANAGCAHGSLHPCSILLRDQAGANGILSLYGSSPDSPQRTTPEQTFALLDIQGLLHSFYFAVTGTYPPVSTSWVEFSGLCGITTTSPLPVGLEGNLFKFFQRWLLPAEANPLHCHTEILATELTFLVGSSELSGMEILIPFRNESGAAGAKPRLLEDEVTKIFPSSPASSRMITESSPTLVGPSAWLAKEAEIIRSQQAPPPAPDTQRHTPPPLPPLEPSGSSPSARSSELIARGDDPLEADPAALGHSPLPGTSRLRFTPLEPRTVVTLTLVAALFLFLVMLLIGLWLART